MMVQINGQVMWRAFRDPGTGTFIGVCDPLKLTARGDTWSELLENTDEIIQLLLSDPWPSP
jgi:predicted RNase H-like HicB family nuclease